MLELSDHPAGDLFSGIAPGLAAKIVGIAVDYRSLSDDIRNAEPVGADGKKGIFSAPQQRRKISRMLWMRGSKRIIVTSGIGKAGSPAAAAAVDMKPIESAGILRKSLNLRHHKGAFPNCVKLHRSPKCIFAPNAGNGIRDAGWYQHINPSRSFYAPVGKMEIGPDNFVRAEKVTQHCRYDR